MVHSIISTMKDFINTKFKANVNRKLNKKVLVPPMFYYIFRQWIRKPVH